MNLTAVENELKNIPFMKRNQTEIIREIFKTYKIKNVLELGFCHGVSTCYMASIFDELGCDGKITTIDRLSAKTREPNIETNLEKLNLKKYVDIYYEPGSYTWRLMKFLEENPRKKFDFCYIDGGHTWDTTGFAFFLVDKLLIPGGIVLFDDINWTIANSPTCKDSKVPEEEKTTAQVEKVFELLVKDHKDYHNFEIINDNWGFAQKKS